MNRSSRLLAGLLAGIVSASASPAKAPELKISGYTIVTSAFSNQNNTDNGKSGSGPYVNAGPSDLTFKIGGTSPSGVEYKYVINFDGAPGSVGINKNYIELNGQFGTFQAGCVVGPDGTMLMDSGAFLVGGAGGIDGAMGGVMNTSAGVISGVNVIGQTKRATKLVWYSPTVSGFQIGASITPQSSHGGLEDKNNNGIILYEKGNSAGIYPDSKKRPYGTQNIAAGISYNQTMDKWTVALAVMGLTERSHYRNDTNGFVPVHNARGYHVTGNIGYDKWRVGAGYLDNGKSRLPKDGTLSSYLGKTHLGNAGKAWNVGTSYGFGPYQVALAYHKTSRRNTDVDRTKSDIWVATFDVNVFPGLKAFVEADYFVTKTNKAAVDVDQGTKSGYDKAIDDNAGTLGIVGMKMSF